MSQKSTDIENFNEAQKIAKDKLQNLKESTTNNDFSETYRELYQEFINNTNELVNFFPDKGDEFCQQLRNANTKVYIEAFKELSAETNPLSPSFDDAYNDFKKKQRSFLSHVINKLRRNLKNDKNVQEDDKNAQQQELNVDDKFEQNLNLLLENQQEVINFSDLDDKSSDSTLKITANSENHSPKNEVVSAEQLPQQQSKTKSIKQKKSIKSFKKAKEELEKRDQERKKQKEERNNSKPFQIIAANQKTVMPRKPFRIRNTKINEAKTKAGQRKANQPYIPMT